MPRCLAYKDGVRVTRRTAALNHMENCVLDTQEELGYPEVVVITSINDGVHTPGGPHDRNMAIDVRTRNGFRHGGMGTFVRKETFAQVLNSKIGSWFTVLLEHVSTVNEHIHVQPTRGTSYP